MKKKEFRLHEQSGLWVARDGEIWVPQSRTQPAHYTYGSKGGMYRTVGYKGKRYLVHRLVAEVYLPNPEGKKEVDHINTNRSDNRVENLRWCTHGENQNNPLTRENLSESLKGEKHPMYGKHHTEETRKKLSEALKKPIIGVNKETGKTVEFESITDAWLTLNIKQGDISACCRGKRKSAGGWKWAYLT